MNDELENINLAIPDIYQPLLDRFERMRGVMICDLSMETNTTVIQLENVRFIGCAAKQDFCHEYKQFAIGE